jgi:hypothetical protein
MSNKAIRQAMENRLNTLPNKPPIAWENNNFTPVTGVGYLSTFMLFTKPDDRGFRDSPYIQRGYMQIGLHWPTNTGPGAAEGKAEEVRAHFKRGTTLVASGVTTVINETPEVTGGSIEDGRYVIRVRIPFYARIEALAA